MKTAIARSAARNFLIDHGFLDKRDCVVSILEILPGPTARYGWTTDSAFVASDRLDSSEIALAVTSLCGLKARQNDSKCLRV